VSHTYRLATLIVGIVLVPKGFEAVGWTVETADLRNAVNVFAGVDGTLLGFLVSAGALLYAVANTRLAENLQRTGHFRRLLVDLFLSCAAFLVALIASLVGLFVPGKGDGFSLAMATQVIVAANAVAFLWLLPVGWKLWVLLSNLEPNGGRALG
jgi:hypothetical protein